MDRSRQTQTGAPGGGCLLAELRESAQDASFRLQADFHASAELSRKIILRWTFLALARRRGLGDRLKIPKDPFELSEFPGVYQRLPTPLFAPDPSPSGESHPVDQHEGAHPARGLRALLLDPTHEFPEEALGAVHESLLGGVHRRKKGVHYTPPELAHRLVEVTLSPLAPGHPSDALPSVCDPAVGSGAFLLAAARRLAGADPERRVRVVEHLYGVDIDPFAVETAALSLWLFAGGETAWPIPGLKTGDALVGIDWASELPAVFDRDRPGFDAVVGNPPFVNGIESHGRRDEATRRLHQSRWPVFCQGTYDACLVFWARALTDLLRDGGRYGLVGPTVLMSDQRPWKAWVHEHCRPEWIRTHPVDHFPGARIRTLAMVGTRASPKAALRFENLDPLLDAPSAGECTVADADTNWHALVVGLGDTSAPARLTDLADVYAGCTAGEAYALARELSDDPELPGPRLVTTGALDRYRCRWGERTIRFLKRDLHHPRWPVEPSSAGLRRALSRQTGPRILVGGLTSVLEAWADEEEASAGVVQTWVVRPKDPLRLRWLLGLLNSAWLSRVLVGRHGAESMTGRQITIRKRALLSSPLPLPGSSEPDRVLEAAVGRLQVSGPLDPEIDKLAHLATSLLFSRTLEQAEEDYRWWASRNRTPPVDRGWSALLTRL